ncbi:MAG: hypothetical protein JXR03_13080 [Cyclobacteriaceae bacterium]
MDAKVTMSFDQEVISKAKAYAEANNISLSRLTEFLYRRITENRYLELEDLPISDWVGMVADGDIEYKKRSRSDSKKEYFDSKK